MLRNTVVASTLLLFSVAVYSSAEYVPGEIIFKLKKSANVSTYANVSQIKGSELKIMKIGKNKDIFTAIQELESNPDVEYAEPNYIFHISNVPNDPDFVNTLWGLNNTAQQITGLTGVTWPTNNPGTFGYDIDAVNAWDIINDCSSIVVAVIDTGVKYDHDDLWENMWNGGTAHPNHGYNYVANDDYVDPTTSNDPMDNCGHGTHIAGVIGASGDNGIGVTGVCWKTQIMAIKSFDSDGRGTTDTVISGIGFAIDHGANIINASFNFYGGSSTALSSEIAAAKNAGILFVASAGNACGSTNPNTPGCNVDLSVNQTYPCNDTSDNVLCVSALDQSFGRASFSNYGSTSVDVSAPGTNIYSTWCSNTASPACSSSVCGSYSANYVVENGTSMATPYAAGLAALVWANNPTFTYSDVKNAIMSSDSKIINATSALAYINKPTGLTAVVN